MDIRAARVIGPLSVGNDGHIWKKAIKNFASLRSHPIAALRGETPSVECPISGEPLMLKGGIPYARAREMAYFYVGSNKCIAIAFRGLVRYVVYPDLSIIINITKNTNSNNSSLEPFFLFIENNYKKIDIYFEEIGTKNLSRAIVLGDYRPLHYLSQAISAIRDIIMPNIMCFKELNNEFVILRDYCFIDPIEFFPAIKEEKNTIIDSKNATDFFFDQKIFGIRFNRLGAENNFDAVRSLLPINYTKKPDILGLWINLDIEKQRFINQASEIASVIKLGTQVAELEGLKLHIFWDGWTVIRGNISSHDEKIIDAAKDEIQKISFFSACSFEETFMFSFDLLKKIEIASTARLACASYGTASTYSSILASVPTVSYGAEEFVRSGIFIDNKTSLVISAPTEDPNVKIDRQKFKLGAGDVVRMIGPDFRPLVDTVKI